MKIKFRNFFVYSLAIFILSLFFLALNKNQNYETKTLINKKIGNFSLKSMDDKTLINSVDLKENNFTLINFWASWCAPCRLEHRNLIKLKDYNVKILGINFKDKKNHAIKFLKDLGNPYYLLAKDEAGKESVKFGVYGIPESILVDNNLKVIKKFIGPLDDNDFKQIVEMTKK